MSTYKNDAEVEIKDASEYQPNRISSKAWWVGIDSYRECIKKIWEVDPLLCPNCAGRCQYDPIPGR